MSYEDFKTLVRQEGEARASQGGLIPIPELRRRVVLDRATFEDYLLRLHTEGVAHLMSHVDTDALPETTREECFRYGTHLLYWVRWL